MIPVVSSSIPSPTASIDFCPKFKVANFDCD